MSAPKKTVLLIEDEPQIVMGLRDALEFEGFHVLSSGKGREGVALARAESPDLVILDIMLPDVSGYTVCEELRRWSSVVPLIMLTARSQETDKIRGLDVGADDYVTKPFSVNELIARMRALLRRASRQSGAPDVLEIDGVTVNLSAHTITTRGGGEATEPLSFFEVELLRLLVERAGQAVSRDEILSKIWGLEPLSTNRTVDNFIVKLRKKIERSPEKPEHIVTVYGFGYKFVAESR